MPLKKKGKLETWNETTETDDLIFRTAGAYPVEPGESPVRRMPRLLSGCAVQATCMGTTSR